MDYSSFIKILYIFADMKVIGINGSSRKNGNTTKIIEVIFEVLKSYDIECEIIELAEKEIAPCKACFACAGNGNCVFTKDDFCNIMEQMKQADGIILGSPVYSADVTATMKALLDRGSVVVATNKGLLRHKVGCSVAAVRRAGGMSAVDTMNHFLLNKEMIIVGSTYWNMVYGKNVGEVLEDEEGIANMKNLGHNIAWLLAKL